jgi:HEAT repeat protein
MASPRKAFTGFVWMVILIAVSALSSCASSTKIVKKDDSNSKLIEVLSKPDQDPTSWNHRRAADLLGAREAREGVPILLKDLDLPNERVVRRCTIALGKIGDPSAVPGLIEHLNGSFVRAADEHVIGEALIALGRIGARNPEVRSTIRPNLERYAQGAGTKDQARWARKALSFWKE